MAIVLVAGAFSAFLVNDTICLVMTPLVLDLVTRLKRDPVPYLLAIPMASNAGSTATITGNPQNMIIGSLSQIPYGTFAAALWPVAAVGVVLTALLIALVYHREFLTREHLPAIATIPARHHRLLVIKSVLVAVAMMVLFFAGQPVAKVAIVGGALLLVTRKVKADKVYREIDWPLLLMFVGLFIVVTGLEMTVLTTETIAAVSRLDLETTPVLSVVTAGLSNLVSNVPAVLVLKPFIANSLDPQRAWRARSDLMSPIWFTPFIIAAGALQAFGAVMSAQLRASLTNPWLALTVLFTLNAFFFAGSLPCCLAPFQRSRESARCHGGRRWPASPARSRSLPAYTASITD